ncbi:hypothetical protein PoB_006738900 [Plakobranchus ocellatus]|uniref:Uncharacterized protein n=1 Tax=Plakobranchus ocellatus TaxID=259542 RepID=A0AAV4D9I0_9GAST|nr:hypothetical protein PoB_006738900 [Plakobranchus ocellatus]
MFVYFVHLARPTNIVIKLEFKRRYLQKSLNLLASPSYGSKKGYCRTCQESWAIRYYNVQEISAVHQVTMKESAIKMRHLGYSVKIEESAATTWQLGQFIKLECRRPLQKSTNYHSYSSSR